MKIPLVDLSLSETAQNTTLHAIKSIIASGNFILGKDVENFEKQFADYVSVKYCVGVATGTDALVLSLKALGIGKGDEVIIPAMTFMATASSVILAGAKPVLVDIRSDLPLIDSQKIDAKLTKKTKAIIPVHLHGYPCDMTLISELARKHNLFVIEDACQSHGTLFNKQRAGSFGRLAAFSFYPSKNLGAFGDGGAVTTSHKPIADKIRTLRNWGAKEKYFHEVVGYNSRLDTIQAAILNLKLKELDRENAKRREHAELYKKLLGHLPIKIPHEAEGMQGNYHIFAIETGKRDTLLTYLKSKNIFCGIHYPVPLHMQPALSFLNYKKGDFPVAEEYASRTLSLPMYPRLTKEQIIYISKQIENFYKNK